MLSRAGNFLAFQLGWFACVLGAAHDRSWLGPLIVACLVTLYLWRVPDWSATIRIVLPVGILGAIVDSTLGLAGVLQFESNRLPNWLCPFWLFTLWVIFATTLQHSLSWLAERWVLASLLGGIFGPISYYAGQELGSLRIQEPLVRHLIILALVWSLLLPLLLAWSAGKGVGGYKGTFQGGNLAA